MLKKRAFIGGFLVGLMVVGNAGAGGSFKGGGGGACYVDDDGNDWFWYCGSQTKNCAGTKPCCSNKEFWLYHGDHFNWEKRGGQGNYWCCHGTGSGAGTFKQGANWIVKTDIIKETLPEGTCSWKQKTNICGDVDNPNDKCTEATEDCVQGYVSHNGKCVKACEDGYAFESKTSNTCVKCEVSRSQGIVKDVCIKCGGTQFFSATKEKCVDFSEMVQISSLAHSECWLCPTPGSLYHCMVEVTNNGRLDPNTQIGKACSLEGKGAEGFQIPEILPASASSGCQLSFTYTPGMTMTAEQKREFRECTGRRNPFRNSD